MIRVLITGGGIIGRNHAEALRRLDGASVTGVVEPVPTAAQSFVDSFGPVTVFATQEEAVASGKFDLAVICTPSGTHADLAMAALEAGLHVVIEKPVDVSLAKARALADVASKLDLLCSVISQHRFDPASVAIQQAVQSGALGKLTSAVATVPWWREQSYYDSAAWRGTWAFDGGVLMNQAIHTVDLLYWHLGEVASVMAFTGQFAHERMEAEDTAVAVLRCSSGALATVHASTSAFPGLPVRLQIHGTKGSAILHDDQLELLTVPHSLAPEHVYGSPKPDDAFVQGHQRQWDDIINAVQNGRPPGVSIDDGVAALAIVRAIYESAETGRLVTL